MIFFVNKMHISILIFIVISVPPSLLELPHFSSGFTEGKLTIINNIIDL